MRQKLIYKISQEKEYLKQLTNNRPWILICLSIFIAGIIITNILRQTLWADLGMILYILGMFGVIRAGMIYAQIKGRSPYWTLLLSYIGLAIVFFLRGKTNKVNGGSKRQSLNKYDLLLITGLTLTVVSFIGMNINTQTLTAKTELGILTLFLLWLGLSPFISMAIAVMAIVFNRRRVISISGWIILLIFSTTLLFTTNTTDMVSYFKAYRNILYFLILTYGIMHIIFHGLIKIFKNDRTIFTPEGVFEWPVYFLTVTYSYAVMDFIKQVIAIS